MSNLLNRDFSFNLKQLITYIIIIFGFGGAVTYKISGIDALEKNVSLNKYNIAINAKSLQTIKEDVAVKLTGIQTDLVWIKEYLKEDSKYKYNKHKYNIRGKS